MNWMVERVEHNTAYLLIILKSRLSPEIIRSIRYCCDQLLPQSRHVKLVILNIS